MDISSLKAGMLLDGFKLEDKIYEGSKATLWIVTHEDVQFPVVMKVPRLKYRDNPATMVGFEVEQMILPTLSGKHIPRFVQAGHFSVCPYIVMEYIVAPSVRELLNFGKMPADDAAKIGAQVATALHEIHRQHVIHLDIKPGNIFLRRENAVIIDFGLAHHDYLPDLIPQDFPVSIESAAYVSPEQVFGVRNDPRSDIFSLGVILYFLVTGKQPFGNRSSAYWLRRRLYRDPLPPRAINPNCTPWLQEVILRCLEVDPEKRFDSAAQLAFNLQNPDQIVLTTRSKSMKHDGLIAVAMRWIDYHDKTPEESNVPIAQRLDTAPIIMAAVDMSPEMEGLNNAIRTSVRRVFSTEKGARLTCVTVRKIPRVGKDPDEKSEHNPELQKLLELKHWARPLGLPADRISFRVIDAPDTASALVDYARTNHVDHIVIGGRSHLSLLRLLGSVSSRIVAEVPCTVTVVRAGIGKEQPEEEIL